MAGANKIKMRSPKSKSTVSKGSAITRKGKKSKPDSKAKLLPNTQRNSHITPQGPKRGFLSPQIVKHESSYCFDSE